MPHTTPSKSAPYQAGPLTGFWVYTLILAALFTTGGPLPALLWAIGSCLLAGLLVLRAASPVQTTDTTNQIISLHQRLRYRAINHSAEKLRRATALCCQRQPLYGLLVFWAVLTLLVVAHNVLFTAGALMAAAIFSLVSTLHVFASLCLFRALPRKTRQAARLGVKIVFLLCAIGICLQQTSPTAAAPDLRSWLPIWPLLLSSSGALFAGFIRPPRSPLP